MRRIAYLLIGCMVLLLATSCDSPVSRPTVDPGAPLLTFERVGGIAGFQDKLLVGNNWQYSLSRGGRPDRGGTLEIYRVAQLATWRDAFAPFTLSSEDNPGGPDNLLRRLVWGGIGRRKASESEQRTIMDFAGELLAQLSLANP